MASLESLPADQRAVLQLVLQRGRSYDEIAKLLSIDRAAVRQRALAALDELGPQSAIAPEQRALITDYLLGQLPGRVSESTRERLAQTPSERAWARVVASELAPLASQPLPEIPVDGSSGEPAPAAERVPASEPAHEALEPRERPRAGAPVAAAATRRERDAAAAMRAPSSRRGGAILLGLAAIAVVAAIVVIIALTSGSSSKKSTTASTAAATSTTPARSTATTKPNIVGQVNLLPTSSSSKSAGVAEVVKQGKTVGIVLRAQNIPANSKHDAYAVWLYNSPSDARLLGFVNPGVGTNGTLTTAGALPSNAGHYTQLVVTLEKQANPHQPGKIVLQGKLSGV